MAVGGCTGAVLAGGEAFMTARAKFGDIPLRQIHLLEEQDQTYLKLKTELGARTGLKIGGSGGAITALVISNHH